MKKLLCVLMFALSLCCICLAACGDNETEGKKDINVADIAWEYSAPFKYDGTEKTVYLTGLPAGVTATYAGNAATRAGEYTATVTLNYDEEKFNAPAAVLPLNWRIEKGDYDFTSVKWNYEKAFNYDGLSKKVELDNLPSGVTAVYKDNEKTDVGEYVAKVEFIYDESNYNKPSFEDLAWKINKRAYDMSGAKWNYNGAFTYDGTEKSVTVKGLPSGVTVKAYTGNSAVNAGNYIASVTFNYDEINYEAPELTNLSWTINKSVYDMSVVKWNYDSAFTYDGSEKTVYVSGLPDGVTVKAYADNKAVNAGSYTASVTFNYDEINYVAPEFTDLSWTINKADYDMSKVKWDYNALLSITYDGSEKTVSIKGELPDGVTVKSYTGNKATEIGNYSATVEFYYDEANYNKPTFAPLAWKIKQSVKDVATKVINAFGSVPDPWEFLPEKYKTENHVFGGTLDYASAVSISDIPKNGIGKQLHAIYSPLGYTETALGYVAEVYKTFSAGVSLYQEYINNHENDYTDYKGTWGVFAVRITIAGEKYALLAKAAGVTVELYSDTADGAEKIVGRIGFIVSGKNVAVKYNVYNDYFRAAINAGEILTSDIEFTRKSGKVTGVVYETTGAGSARLTTCSVLEITDNYLIITGNKGDFAVPGQGVNVEVYKNATGSLCGTEVYEDIKTASYDTCWFNIYDIGGINNIKAVMGTKNDKNPDSIYLNGSEKVFLQEFNSKLGIKTSRQYDIEFKTMYFYKEVEGETGKYELVEQKIPMLFVQRANLNDYVSDIKKNNDGLTVSNNSLSADNAVIAAAYNTYLPVYKQLKEKITYEITVEYVGERNDWFDQENPAGE